MKKLVNVHEAKTHLSRLLRRVAKGEEIVIARAGRPVARLAPLRRGNRAEKKLRPLGLYEGKTWIAPDFNEEDPEINALFYGGEIEPPP